MALFRWSLLLAPDVAGKQQQRFTVRLSGFHSDRVDES